MPSTKNITLPKEKQEYAQYLMERFNLAFKQSMIMRNRLKLFEKYSDKYMEAYYRMRNLEIKCQAIDEELYYTVKILKTQNQ